MKKHTRLEAPDGGWGFLICIGLALPLSCGLGAISSFALVFGDFLKSIGAETSAVTLITSAFFCALSFAGLFSGSLFNHFGVRTIGLFGAFIYFFGSLMQIFAQTTWHLLLAFSVCQGIGLGLMLPTSYTTFNSYFIKKRVMCMSFAQALIGFGTMFYPVGVHKLLELYGFRGCLLILAGFNSHVILGMLLMQPVEWHMKRVAIIPDDDGDDEEIIALSQMCDNGKDKLSVNLELNTETTHVHINSLTALKKTKIQHSSEHHSRNNLSTYNRPLSASASYSSSIASLSYWTGEIVVRDVSSAPTQNHPACVQMSSIDAKTQKHKSHNCWQVIVDFLDLTLLKKPIYVNIVLGMAFALYSDMAFFTLQPLYLFELGFTKADTASIIAIGAAADLASRIFLAFSTIFIQMPSRHIFLAGSFFTFIGRFAFLYVFNYTEMACATAVLGFLRTWVHVPCPLVFAEYLPQERFGTGYGLFMFLQGNIMFAIGPVIGYLQDQTKNYNLTFHCLNFFMALCAVPWLIEILFVKFKRKDKKIIQVES